MFNKRLMPVLMFLFLFNIVSTVAAQEQATSDSIAGIDASAAISGQDNKIVGSRE